MRSFCDAEKEETSVHQSIICDFVEGKLFRLNAETGEKEEINDTSVGETIQRQHWASAHAP